LATSISVREWLAADDHDIATALELLDEQAERMNRS